MTGRIAPKLSSKVEHIAFDGELLALILRSQFFKEGIEFFTPNTFSQQLGYMNRPKDYVIPAHRHTLQPRKVDYTNEVLFVKSGRVRVDFYRSDNKYVSSRILEPGDVILLVSGGHGFRMLEPTEMIEVKQGPYAGDEDKTQICMADEREIVLVQNNK
jgi:mannose-6-phosphate isomerase-like protein (cupin superfamily)